MSETKKQARDKIRSTQKPKNASTFNEKVFTAKMEVMKVLRSLGVTPYGPILNWDKDTTKDEILARSKDDYFFRIRCRQATIIKEKDRKDWRIKVQMYSGRAPKEGATARNTAEKRKHSLKANTDIVALYLPASGPFKKARVFWIPADEIDPTKQILSFPVSKLREVYEEFPWEAHYES